MPTAQTFSPFSVATLSNYAPLRSFVGVQGAIHQLNTYQEAANSQGAELTNQLMREVMDGPPTRADLSSLFTLVATDSVLKADDPMMTFPGTLQQRSEESHAHQREMLPGWLAVRLAMVTSPDGASRLTQTLVKQALLRKLAETAAQLRDESAAIVQEVQKSEDQLRQRTASILRAKPKPSSAKAATTYSPWVVFLAVAGFFQLAAFALKVLADVPIVPEVLGVCLLGIVAGAVAVHYSKRPVVKEDDEGDQPFRPLRSQFIAHARAMAESQKLREKLQIVDFVREILDRTNVPDALPEQLRAVQSILQQQNEAIPDRMWGGSAPTYGGLTGKLLVKALWEIRKPRWVNSTFEKAFRSVYEAQGIEEMLLNEPAGVAADILSRAAEYAMQPVTFVESVEATLHSVPGGKRFLIGEFESQIGLLKGLLPIQSYKLKSADSACPLLVHIVLPAALEGSLKSVLVQAFPNETLDFYITNEDEQVLIAVESFNRANSERASHSVYASAFNTYGQQAELEEWSAFGPLCSDGD